MAIISNQKLKGSAKKLALEQASAFASSPMARAFAPGDAAVHLKAANAWRDQYNPLRSLTIARAVALLEAGERGEYADVQWLYRFVEMTDPTLSALITRYESGLAKLDWQIKSTPEEDWAPGLTQALIDDQVGALREQFDVIGNLRQAIDALTLANFRGYAHLEKFYGGDRFVPDVNGNWELMPGDGPRDLVTHLEPVEQWYWVRNGHKGVWQYNRDATSGARKGQAVDLDRFVIRERCRPINRIGLISYVLSNIGLKDYAGFIETFGIPPTFIIGPPDTNPNREASYQETVEKIISNARGYLPNGTDVKMLEAGLKGQAPFKEFMDFLSSRVVLVGTGGKLTMLTESGSGTLAGGAHQDAWEEICQAEAMRLSETLMESIGSPLLNARFPGRPHGAYFELCSHDESEPGAVVDQVQKLNSAGYNTDPQYVEEKTGHKLAMVKEGVSLPVFRIQAEAYGIAVRAGAITPNLKDEEHFRTLAGLPPAGPEVRRQWAADPTREPITLQGDEPSPAFQSGRPGQTNAKPGTLPNRETEPPDENDIERAADMFRRAVASDMQPVVDRLAAIMAIEDPALMQSKLLEFLRDIDRMKKDIGADPASARALEQIQSAALAKA